MELLKCPFCGGEASIHGERRAFVKCDTCGVRTASYRFKLGDIKSITEAYILAAKRWNERSK